MASAFYLHLINAEFKAELQKPIGASDLPKRDSVLNSIESYLQKNPLKKGHFNHYRPSRFFAEHIGALTASIKPETLDRFEEAFRKLNQLL